MGVYKNNNGNLELIPATTLFADNPIGTILAYGGATAPKGWFLCQGQAISRTEYSELFSVIGTSFGNGDGTTTFNLPDLRNKFAEGSSTSNVLGSEKSAGLPNIKGNVNLRSGPSQYPTIIDFNNAFKNSVFKDTSTSQFTTFAIQEGSNSYKDTIKLNAHDYNAIYSDDVSTVQPPAVCVNFIIKAKQVSVPADFAGAAEAAGAAAAEEVVALKQNITDNSLQTTAKTVPGAINELNTDKLNKYYLDTSGLDLDNCTDAGLYEINTAVANMPPGADGGNMIVSYNPQNNAVVQTYFATNGQIASRYKSGSNAWTLWVTPFENRPVLHYSKNIQGTTDGSGNIILSDSLDNVVVVNARIRGNNTWSLGYTTSGGYYLHVQGYNGESLPNVTVNFDIIYYQYDWTA